ncbi:MAG TPA: thioredoxin family protein [Gemmatimonadales bacterium]
MPINQDRRRFIATSAATLVGSELAMLGATKSALHAMGLASDRGLSALRGATTWLNSPPLTAEGLRGKVVLVDFWTYTCINWLRTLPYVRAWAKKYGEHGLVVIGAHTPEYGFEHDLDNVRRAVKEMRVTYPVAVDNDYAIWNGFDNQYWPALYFIDPKGVIRHHQFGEGEYDQAEAMIQTLLTEARIGGVGHDTVAPDARGIEVAADWDNLRSPENYLGSERTEGFVSKRDVAKLRLNEWTVAGNWTIGRNAVTLNEANGRIVSRFHARDLHMVLGPATRGASVRYQVRIDGQPATSVHGVDVDAQGQGAVTEQRLYQLIRQQRPIADRQFEIEFLDPGVEAFAFTFG